MRDTQDEPDRYLLTNGNESGALERGFDWLTDEWQDTENRDTVIAVPSKTNLDNIKDQMTDLIGENAFNQLRSSDNRVDVGKGVTLHTMTRRIHPSRWEGGPVLGLFVDDDQLGDIEGLRGTSSIFVVPWNRSDVEEWETKRSPEIIEFDSE